MLNKEYYKDLFVEASVEGDKIGFKKNTKEPVVCSILNCYNCAFNDGTIRCGILRKQWANSEYNESKIHWEDVPVDTPVYLNYDSRKDIPAHFASYDAELGKIRVFDDGRTSFTVKSSHICGGGEIPETTQYLACQVTLAREEDKEKYYHR